MSGSEPNWVRGRGTCPKCGAGVVHRHDCPVALTERDGQGIVAENDSADGRAQKVVDRHSRTPLSDSSRSVSASRATGRTGE